MMAPFTVTVLCGILFGAVAFFLVFPMAELISDRVERDWAIEVKAHALSVQDAAAPARHPYPPLQKLGFAIVAVALAFTVLTLYGANAEGVALVCYFFGLLLLAAINVKSTMLPDVVTFPTLWLGLLYYTYAGSGAEHVYGAVAGYLVPFGVALAFKLSKGQEVIGQGDLKALAMAGAWFGVAALPWILAGFVVGSLVWALLIKLLGKMLQGWICTGPAHVMGSVVALLAARAF
ncbi:MAG: hypothetical protein RLZZ618_1229 [Pseudomonadota bacterium]|jgi:prepilin signal peptidase PulO-like enzyme (type II secretory pathway)